MLLKLRLGRGFLALALLLPSLALGRGLDDASDGSDVHPSVLVLQDGTRLEVRSYSVKGQIVVFQTLQGRLQSVAAAMVDFEATYKAGDNGPTPSNGAAKDVVPETAMQVVNGTVSDEQGGATSAAFDSEEDPTNVSGRSNATGTVRRPSSSPVFPVGDDEDPTMSAARAPSGVLTIEGPAPPEAPEVIARDAEGRVTVRATRISEPLNVDGKLEEGLYRTIPSMGDFIQQEPHEGQPATEKTEVWVFFDEDNVYVAARCWDSQPERMVANEMRRDNRNLMNNANFAVILDTFYDRRNGFFFYTNPLGGLYDAQVTDEQNSNSDWNTIWQVKTGRFAQGWTVEMELPFKSLRYKPGASQVWGVNFRRIVRWKNETSHLTPIAAAFRRGGILKLSQAATLVGIEPPARSLNLELKPYVTGGVRTDLEAEPAYDNDLDADVGFDVKYGVTRSMTFDFTYNTDFAQVENDEAQVNLTRFSLFFPEKREFFLEGQGIFNFGGRSTNRHWGGGSDMPIIFYSRRIGYQDEVSVPLNLGGRLTGRAGKYSVGALAMQTRDAVGEESLIPPTNHGVMRFKRDVFRRSNIGVIGTYRSHSLDDLGSNSVFGVDGNFTFFQNLRINTYWARSWTGGYSGDDQSYMGKLEYGGDRYGITLEHLAVGLNFKPELGYLRREDMIKNHAQFRFSPRPHFINAVRQFSFEGSFDYITDTDWILETRTESFEFRTEFENGDFARFEYKRSYEFLPEEWDITDDILLPVGGYGFQDFSYMYRFGPQRRISGMVDFNHGSFYSGSRKSVGFRGRAEITKQLSFEPGLSQNWIDLAEGDFTTTLVSVRTDYTFSPRSYLGALVQYSASDDYFSSNIRFRWEYRPGSDIYVVYSDGRDTFYGGFPRLENRSLVFKVTRLFRF